MAKIGWLVHDEYGTQFYKEDPYCYNGVKVQIIYFEVQNDK